MYPSNKSLLCHLKSLTLVQFFFSHIKNIIHDISVTFFWFNLNISYLPMISTLQEAGSVVWGSTLNEVGMLAGTRRSPSPLTCTRLLSIILHWNGLPVIFTNQHIHYFTQKLRQVNWYTQSSNAWHVCMVFILAHARGNLLCGPVQLYGLQRPETGHSNQGFKVKIKMFPKCIETCSFICQWLEELLICKSWTISTVLEEYLHPCMTDIRLPLTWFCYLRSKLHKTVEDISLT